MGSSSGFQQELDVHFGAFERATLPSRTSRCVHMLMFAAPFSRFRFLPVRRALGIMSVLYGFLERDQVRNGDMLSRI